MSKKWKVVIAIVAALVVVIVGAGWYMASQGWTPGTLAQSLGLVRPLEVRLINDNGDSVPDRGVVDLPTGPAFDRGFERGAGREATTGQLAVRLVDDNGDGIPDRGVIDQAPKGAFSRDFEPSHGRDFESARGRHFGLPFLFLGGLIGLGLLTGLTIFFYRRRQSTPPTAPVEVQPAAEEIQQSPEEVQPTPEETRLEPPASGESTGDESNEVAMDNTP